MVYCITHGACFSSARSVPPHVAPSAMRRFALLSKVRQARAFSTLQGRQHLVAMRLSAMTLMAQSNPTPGACSPCACMHACVCVREREGGAPLT